jgi:hypothetical protein
MDQSIMSDQSMSGATPALPAPEPISTPPTPTNSQISPDTETAPAHHESVANVALSEVFIDAGGRLTLDFVNLKAGSKGDYTKRLTYLFLFANQEIGKTSISRAELNRIWTQAQVRDANARSFISHDPHIAIEGDSVRLRASGHPQVQEFLLALSNREAKDSWLPSPPTRRRKESPNQDQDQANAPTTGPAARGRPGGTRVNLGKAIEAWVAAWNKAPPFPTSQGHAFVRDHTVLDQALFGLWAIRKVSDDENPTVSTSALSRFLAVLFEVNVAESSIRGSLRKSGAKLVLTQSAAKYQITQSGMEHIQGLLASSGK